MPVGLASRPRAVALVAAASAVAITGTVALGALVVPVCLVAGVSGAW